MRLFEKIEEDNQPLQAYKNSNKVKFDLKSLAKSWFSNGRITGKFITIIIAFTVIPCILTYFISGFLIKFIVLNNYMPSYLEGVYSNIEKNLNNYLFQINNFSTSVTIDSFIYNVWLDDSISIEDKNIKIRDFLHTYIEGNDFISNVDIITTTNQIFRYREENLDPVRYSFQNDIKPSNVAIYDELITNENGEKYFAIGKRVYNFKTGYHLGYMYIYVNEKVFASTFKDIVTFDNSFFILNGDRVVSHLDKSNLGKLLIMTLNISNQSKQSVKIGDVIYGIYTLNLQATNISKWKIVSIMSYQAFFQSVIELKKEIGFIIFCAVLISVFLSFCISFYLNHSINVLKQKMQKFVSGDINEVNFKFREIAALEYSFDKMVIEINDLISKNNEEKEKQKIAEMKALQAQINPHFIYNALDAIQWHAKIQKQYYIADMIYALASFFRISLHKGDSIIKVWEEIKHVKSYVDIEQMRFPKLFEVIYQIQEDILDCDIPKIVLQPIFENSIKHGFDNIESGGLITITGYRDNNGDIMFEIEDNGKGLEIDPLDSSIKSKGYGVRNVNERLRLECGEGYGLEYRSIKGACTWCGVKMKDSESQCRLAQN